jgi:hypothetical protein
MEISGGKVDPPKIFDSCNFVGNDLSHCAQIDCSKSMSAEIGEDNCSKTRYGACA